MLPYEVKTILKYLANRKLIFSVTPKSEKALSFKETLSISKATIFIIVLLTVGLISMNPLGIFYNITWLAPFFVSPLIIYSFSKTTRPDINNSGVDFQMTATNGASANVTCLCSQPETVSLFLNSMRA